MNHCGYSHWFEVQDITYLLGNSIIEKKIREDRALLGVLL